MVAEPDMQTFETDDEDDFLHKARQIMENPELAKRLAGENAERGRAFSPDAMTEAYAALF